MDFEKIKQTMTKEEFLNDDKLTSYSGCPNEHGLKNENNCFDCDGNCRECWKKAIENNNVKFKDDNTKEKKVIEALKVITNYCKGEFCPGCKFNTGNSTCIIADKLQCYVPHLWDIKLIEDMIKPKVTIYKVEHREGEQRYSFVSDEKLSLEDMVVCDTCKGKSYGKVVAICKDIDDGYKKCWKVK